MTDPLRCEMTHECKAPVTHIDIKGWVYCAEHGRERKIHCRCRKLKPKELKTLQSGEPLTKY